MHSGKTKSAAKSVEMTRKTTQHLCNSFGLDEEFNDVVDRMEQDTVCAFVAATCTSATKMLR